MEKLARDLKNKLQALEKLKVGQLAVQDQLQAESAELAGKSKGEEKTPQRKEVEVLQRVLTVQLLQSENLCTALAAKHEALTEKTALAAFSAASGVEKMKKERVSFGLIYTQTSGNV